MPSSTTSEEQSIPRLNDEVAVGSDMEFQRKWWRFEKAIWSVFCLILIAALTGTLGRGFLANAEARASDGSISVKYERFARYGTPSILRVQFEGVPTQDQRIHVWLSEDLLTSLGNQRVAPQPVESSLDAGGILYAFPVLQLPSTVEFALRPAKPGINHLSLRVPGQEEVRLRIVVWP